MHGYYDIHLHLLPGVDDGPADLAAALAHAERLVAHDIRDAVVTPHVGHPGFGVVAAEVPVRTEALQRALDRAALGLRLRPGGELHQSAALTIAPADLAHIAQGPPAARWILLEAPFAGIGDDFLDACARVRALDYALVIAHPERAAGFLAGGLERLAGELALGAVLQVSVDSLLGHHGPSARAGATAVLWRQLPAVVASDGHGGRRDQTLRQGERALLAGGLGAWSAREATRRAPRRLVEQGTGAVAGTPSEPAVA